MDAIVIQPEDMDQLDGIDTNPVDTGLTEQERERLLQDEIADALSYISTEIAPRREVLQNAYDLDMSRVLPSQTGRSSVVDGSVNSQIGMMLPSLMKIMAGGQKFWEYLPNSPADEAAAKEATDFVNNIVMRVDNDGELILHDWGKDGLLQIVGVVAVWWEEAFEWKPRTVEGINELGLAALYLKTQASGGTLRIAGQERIQSDGMAMYNLIVEERIDRSHVCIVPIPPEEWVISRDAKSQKNAVLRSHRTLKKVGDLIAAGYDEEIVLALPSYDDLDWDGEALNRNSGSGWNPSPERDADPMLREVVVHRGIVRCDADGTGIKEWYFVAGGSTGSVKIMEWEEYKDQIHFCDWGPNPTPHTYFGRCPADDVFPIQKVKTAVLRQTMDNLYLSLAPQRLVNLDLFGKGGIESLMNMRPGGPVPVKDTQLAIRDIEVPFFADKSFSMLGYFDDEAEKRTGVSRASMGLDPDTLQNQSATAAAIAHTASQGKVEMVAKLWAVGGMRKLARAILRVLKRYQGYERDIRVNGQNQRINPQQWREFEDWEAQINTGLGTGTREKDAQALMMVMQEQKQIIQAGGPSNGLVTPGQFVNAMMDFIEATGLSHAERYITKTDPAMVPPPPQPPGPNPDTLVYAQIEKEKIDQKDAEAAAELTVKREIEQAKIASDAAIEREKIAVDREIRLTELTLKYQANADTVAVDAAKLKIEQAKLELATAVKMAPVEEKKAEKAEDNSGRQELAVAIGAMSAALKEMNKPKRIVRDKAGRAIGTEASE